MGLELLAQPRDVLLEGGLRIRGRIVPHSSSTRRSLETVSPGVEKQDREHASLLDPAESQFPLAVEHFERSEDAEVERRRQAANVPRSPVRRLTGP